MENNDDFPYQAEYAKSSRASCRHCKSSIEKASLRLAAVIQSPSFDGKITHWYHYMCFFAKQRPKSVEDIAHFDSLRWEDQQKIKTKLESGGLPTTPSGGKKGKKAAKDGFSDYSVEVAKSGRAGCRVCEEKVLKGVIRISKKDYESDTAKRYGPCPRWHHVDCFVKNREELEFFGAAEDIPGFNTLSADDKKMLREKIKKINGKRKAEDEPDNATKKIKKESDELMQKQNKRLFYYRDQLEKQLKKSELVSLLEHNDYDPRSGVTTMLDILADLMTFGVPERCSACNNGNFIYKSGIGYMCKGNMTEWTKCTHVTDMPKRKPFKIPEEFKKEYEFLSAYKYKDVGNRVVTKRKEAEPKSTNKLMSSCKPLENLKFVIVGKKFSKDIKDMKSKIKSLGGEVVSKIEPTTAAVITTAEMVGGTDKKILAAKEKNIQCVSEDFLDEIEKGGALLMITKKNIAPWGTNPEERVFANSKPKSSSASSSGSKYTKSLSKTMKVKLKGGAAVDPDSELQDHCHVYQRGGLIYNSVLGYVDLVKGSNSYYKLQIIEADDTRSWWVFRSWGRIGTTIGSNKLQEADDVIDALKMFNDLYEEKTGQKFTSKEQIKLPGRWYPLEIEYENEKEESTKIKIEESDSKLPIAVQKLVSLIFDINTMKNAMVEFEIDLEKMPLGKLSRRQLENAYKVLAEALEWLEKLDHKEKDLKADEDIKSATSAINGHLLDCSNRFYTLIPHDFGMKSPPLLDNEDLIKAKIDMVDNLREIEIAYSLLKSEDGSGSKGLNSVDKHYKKLKTEMGVLEKSSDEFKMIEKYVKNTHASTHSHFSLDITEVFTIDREGEKKRFKPFKKLHNHQLLWHGSRLTNFAGILSQGLRIAPPEAPVTGYMFGKGVYFADMVSKSANYCCASSSNSTGLLLLCDVALGDMYELTNAKSITKLPKGKHSTKGLGRTCPDPAQIMTVEDGLQVPLGPGQNSSVKSFSLLYNEYIVYDVAQIKVKYLVQGNFNFNYEI